MFDIKQIIKSIKKDIRPVDILLIGILLILFFVTRLVNLENFPIFGDEGIYIHWAKVAQRDASWRFISLTDGRQPLHTWGMIPFIKLFPDNALIAGRLFSVATGLIAISGIFSFCYLFLNKKAAYIGTFIYIFTPAFLFYDRMALIDSGVNAAFIWILLFSLLLSKYRRLDIALIFGMISGLALLTKSSVRLFLGLCIFAPITFIGKKLKDLLSAVTNFYLLFVIAMVVSASIYNVQRLSPYLHFVEEKNKTFVMTFSDWFSNPFAYFPHNFKLIPYYLLIEGGAFLFILAIVSYLWLARKNVKLFSYFSIWLFCSYLVIAFFSIVLYPRYIIFFISLFIIWSSYLVSTFKQKKYILIMIAGLFIYNLPFNYSLLVDAKSAAFPEIDKGQYIRGGTAGWGTKEIVEFARGKSKNKEVILMAEGNFGVIGDMLDVYLRSGDRIVIRSYWPLTINSLNQNQKDLGKYDIYVVFAHTQNPPLDWPIKLVKKYPKPDSKEYYLLYQLVDERFQ